MRLPVRASSVAGRWSTAGALSRRAAVGRRQRWYVRTRRLARSTRRQSGKRRSDQKRAADCLGTAPMLTSQTVSTMPWVAMTVGTSVACWPDVAADTPAWNLLAASAGGSSQTAWHPPHSVAEVPYSRRPTAPQVD